MVDGDEEVHHGGAQDRPGHPPRVDDGEREQDDSAVESHLDLAGEPTFRLLQVDRCGGLFLGPRQGVLRLARRAGPHARHVPANGGKFSAVMVERSHEKQNIERRSS